ncbi:MAG: PhzF family phenazine biosynthesis protein [Steroidobacteraceae bacterium]
MRLHYRLLNVFTRTGETLSGNPLCVFEDGRSLDTATMQALALQFNLSETTFILPSTQATAGFRIFTPSYEMPFAGHPTLGTAAVVADLQGTGASLQLELPARIITVTRDAELWELCAPKGNSRPSACSPTTLAGALGLDPQDLAGDALWVDTGVEQLVVPVANPAALARVRLGWDGLTWITADGTRAQVYLFAEVSPGRLKARFFFDKGESVLEDPATGSATANLGGWYQAMGWPTPLERDIEQGEATGRPASLRLRIDAAGSIFVAGRVAELGRGFIDL